MQPPKRIPQEVKLLFRYLADACLLLVDRELELTHDLAQSSQGLFGFALSAQDHEVVGIGHDARAEASKPHVALRGNRREQAHAMPSAGCYHNGRFAFLAPSAPSMMIRAD